MAISNCFATTHSLDLPAIKMRIILTTFIISISQMAFAQLDQFIGTWITSQNEFLEIRDTTNKYDNSNHLSTEGRDEGMAVFLFDDTLSFQKRYYSSATNYEKLYIDRYDLKVLNHNDSILVVKPVSKLSKKFFREKDSLTFIRQKFAIDNDINIEKVVFHTSGCFGSCPTYHLQIEKNKKVKLHVQTVYQEHSMYDVDSSKIGYFEGSLDEINYQELELLLKTCNLRTLEFDGANCCDGSLITIIVYFNNQRKYLQSMFPPEIATELISHLYKICEETDLDRVEEQFEIEK